MSGVQIPPSLHDLIDSVLRLTFPNQSTLFRYLLTDKRDELQKGYQKTDDQRKTSNSPAIRADAKDTGRDLFIELRSLRSWEKPVVQRAASPGRWVRTLLMSVPGLKRSRNLAYELGR